MVAWQRARSMSRFSFSQRSMIEDSSVAMSRVLSAPWPRVSKLAPAGASGAPAVAAAPGAADFVAPAAASPACGTGAGPNSASATVKARALVMNAPTIEDAPARALAHAPDRRLPG